MPKILRGSTDEFEKTIFANLPDARDVRNMSLMVTAAVLLGKAISKRGK
jgi:hypothetical protein